eukprot:SAG22_NODE_1258_length_4983_cov_2.401925_4_plen_129_part_00
MPQHGRRFKFSDDRQTLVLTDLDLGCLCCTTNLSYRHARTQLVGSFVAWAQLKPDGTPPAVGEFVPSTGSYNSTKAAARVGETRQPGWLVKALHALALSLVHCSLTDCLSACLPACLPACPQLPTLSS